MRYFWAHNTRGSVVASWLAILIFWSLAAAQPKTALIQLFSAPDESSLVVETLGSGVELTPLAETIVPSSGKWFLVKTPLGATGWIKAGPVEAADKVARYFQALPKENVTIVPGSDAPQSGGGKITVPVNARGSHVIVPVTFNGSVTVPMYLDTGAGQTMISKKVAGELRLFRSGSDVRVGIGGAVSVSTAQVESVRVGEAEVANLKVSIHDFARAPGVEGLLGFDFLRYFHVALDAQKQQLELTPRK
ncbi:MAG: hypothetical protein FJ145_19140 [Deltaproteobacteria bacterium]|nr:hypothetical protein [Deltaproteobacteria bacterium]